MPVSTNEEPIILNQNTETHYLNLQARNKSVNDIIKTISMGQQFSLQHDILQYNLVEHAKRIEKSLFEYSDSDSDYFRSVNEKIVNIKHEISAKNQLYMERAGHNRGRMVRSEHLNYSESQKWRHFYSFAVRQAVIDALVKETQSNVEIPLRFLMGLTAGIEAIEHSAYKEAESRSEYFEILHKRNAEMLFSLQHLFK